MTEVEPPGGRAKLIDCSIYKIEKAGALPVSKAINGIAILKNIANKIKRKLTNKDL